MNKPLQKTLQVYKGPLKLTKVRQVAVQVDLFVCLLACLLAFRDRVSLYSVALEVLEQALRPG